MHIGKMITFQESFHLSQLIFLRAQLINDNYRNNKNVPFFSTKEASIF